MASRPTVSEQPRCGAVAGKTGLAKENNRRALEDIGNFVNVRADEAKPQQELPRLVTRSFCAQSQTNAEAAAAENKKKPVKVVDGAVVGKGGVETKLDQKKVTFKPTPDVIIDISSDREEETRKEKFKPVHVVDNEAGVGKGDAVTKAAQKKVTVKLKPETIIEISSDREERTKQEKSISRKGSSRKKVQTLTSVLTARSKYACGLTHKPEDPVSDIDAADVGNQLAVVDYVEDLYKFYKLTENSSRVHDYMKSQPDINEQMRAILMDWLIDVHKKFELMPETLYLTLHIVDRFLSVKTIRKMEMQLVGISAMLIASKYEEMWAPEVDDFICISDMAYTREKILAMEKEILGKLEWSLTFPTPYVFLVRFIKAALSDKEMENLVFYLAELGVMHYATIIYCPSMIAASAVYAAQCTLNKSPLWSETLKLYTGFSEPQLMDCAKLLVNFHSRVAKSKLKVVYKKYLSPQHGAVALLLPAKKLLA